MKKFYSIGEAARIVHITSETLRHYDRIGLVKPGKKDEWTNYRYYTKQDIVRLNAVRLLQLMDFSLQEMKKILDHDSLEIVEDYLVQAEKKIDEKIAALQYGKSEIQSIRSNYERKLPAPAHKNPNGTFIREMPQRVILLSDTLEVPTLENLWNYLGHFYEKVTPALKDQFSFEILAGVYTEKGMSRLFAICTRHVNIDELKILPKGKYLCADCTEENKEQVLNEVVRIARTEYGVKPMFIVQLVILSCLLYWNYEVQVYVDK